MSFKKELEERLEGGKFRLLNEKMYKNTKLSKSESEKYHFYYSKQISKWPVDPNKIIFQKVEEMNKKDIKIADLGCGDGKYFKNIENVTFYDKHPMFKGVIEADIMEIPCENETFDISICCLSLMMTYISKAILEVNRITKTNGIFIIAEVKSRFSSVHRFVNDMGKYGFEPENIDTSNKCFVVMTFKKVKHIISNKKLPTISLNPCVYKKK